MRRAIARGDLDTAHVLTPTQRALGVDPKLVYLASLCVASGRQPPFTIEENNAFARLQQAWQEAHNASTTTGTVTPVLYKLTPLLIPQMGADDDQAASAASKPSVHKLPGDDTATRAEAEQRALAAEAQLLELLAKEAPKQPAARRRRARAADKAEPPAQVVPSAPSDAPSTAAHREDDNGKDGDLTVEELTAARATPLKEADFRPDEWTTVSRHTASTRPVRSPAVATGIGRGSSGRGHGDVGGGSAAGTVGQVRGRGPRPSSSTPSMAVAARSLPATTAAAGPAAAVSGAETANGAGDGAVQVGDGTEPERSARASGLAGSDKDGGPLEGSEGAGKGALRQKGEKAAVAAKEAGQHGRSVVATHMTKSNPAQPTSAQPSPAQPSPAQPSPVVSGTQGMEAAAAKAGGPAGARLKGGDDSKQPVSAPEPDKAGSKAAEETADESGLELERDQAGLDLERDEMGFEFERDSEAAVASSEVAATDEPGALRQRLAELEEALQESNARYEKEHLLFILLEQQLAAQAASQAALDSALRTAQEREGMRLQALQLRLYIADTRCKALEEALLQHVEAVGPLTRTPTQGNMLPLLGVATEDESADASSIS